MSDLPNGKALAKAFLVDQDDLYAVNQRICVLTTHKDIPQYLFHSLNRNPYFLKFDDGVNQTHLLNPVFKKCPILLPPTKVEQEAIARALSDADALIESLEQLLTKKRQIKQGAMQELLTGKRRLPGFSGEWETTTIGDISFRIIGGGTPSRANKGYWNGGIPWMTVKDFAQFNKTGTLEYITQEGLNNSASYLIKQGALIVSTRMAVGKAVIFDVDVAINQDLKAIIFEFDMDSAFMYYWFQCNEAAISELGSGSTVMGIALSDLRKIPFCKPTIEEQRGIVSVLTDMDAEIAALEDKLTKAKAIKQGMMQELLTGRIRLV